MADQTVPMTYVERVSYDTGPDLTNVAQEVTVTTAQSLQQFRHTPRRAEIGRLANHLAPDCSEIPHLENILRTDPVLGRVANKVLQAPRAEGTMANYDGVVRDFKDFCANFDYDFREPNEQSVIHFLLNLEHDQKSFAYCVKVKPALELHGQLTGKQLKFNQTMNGLLQGVKNLSAKRKPDIKKPKLLELSTIKTLVKREVLQFKDNPSQINLVDFRTIFRIVVEYYLFARFDDFSQLRAKHFHRFENPDYIIVHFPSRKNDQHHDGFLSVLSKKESMCPVFLSDLYFKCMGLNYGNKGTRDEGFVSCRVRKAGPRQVGETQYRVSRTTACEHLRTLLHKHGFPSEGVTDKSAKVQGVTRCLEAGTPLVDGQLHGGWKTDSVPLAYKHNSIAFKRKLADNVPDE